MLQTDSHIRRYANNILLETEVAWVYHIALTYTSLVLLFKAFERLYRILLPRLDLYREHLVFKLAIVGYEEVYFDVVAVLLGVVLRIEIQLVTVHCQHLSDSVLIEHSLVHVQLVTEYLLVYLIFEQFVLVKGMADKQSCIAEVTLHIRSVLFDRQSHIRVIAQEAFAGDNIQ